MSDVFATGTLPKSSELGLRLIVGGPVTTSVTAVECVGEPAASVPVMVTVKLPIGVVLPAVTFIVEEPDPPVTDCGLNVAFAPEGKPLALRLTVPVYPRDGVTVTV